MTREEVFEYVKKIYGIEPDHPFPKDFDSSVMRHRDTRKWFGLVMNITADKIGYDDNERMDILTIKSEPMLIDALTQKEGFHRAYHMNKSQWLSIELNEKVDDEEVKSLIRLSYDLTDKKKK